MKKSLLVLSGVLAISTALAGCGSKSDDNAAATTTPGSTTSTKAPVTIKVQAWYTEAQGNWNKTVEAYNATHPNVKVVYESMSEKGDSQEGMKKLDLLAASGEQMDVVMYSSASDFAQRVGAGILEPLDAYLKKDNIVVKDEYKLDPVKMYQNPGY